MTRPTYGPYDTDNDGTELWSIPADLFVSINNGKVTGMSVAPREGDAGYFGPVGPETMWDIVSDYLDMIRCEAANGTATYPIGWEG